MALLCGHQSIVLQIEMVRLTIHPGYLILHFYLFVLLFKTLLLKTKVHTHTHVRTLPEPAQSELGGQYHCHLQSSSVLKDAYSQAATYMKPPSPVITTSSVRRLLKDLPEAVSNPECFNSNFTHMTGLEDTY